MDAQSFTSLASVGLPSRGKLFQNSWCPDKDLLAVITRHGTRDKLGLWKMQGSRKWETDVDGDLTGPNTIMDIAWSPDGMMAEQF